MGLKHKTPIKKLVLDLRQEGLSYRAIARKVQQIEGVRLSHSTARVWCEGGNLAA